MESGTTVIENALMKARHYHSAAYPWVFSDDTGLEIDALNDEPGVQTRRWGGRFADDISDQAWLEYLLLRMKNVPLDQRTASFVDGWALIDPQQNEYTHLTRSSFHIATHSIRPTLPGSPIMAVALGIPEDPAQIVSIAKEHWEAWGIMKQITASGTQTHDPG